MIALSGVFRTGGVSLWYLLFPIFLTENGYDALGIGVVFSVAAAASLLGLPLEVSQAIDWGVAGP